MGAPVIRASCFVRAPQEQVFDAFVVPNRLTTWFAATEAAIDARPDGDWRFCYAPGHYSSGTFAEIERPSRIVLNWNEWHENAEGNPLPGEDTAVVSTCTITITPEGAGSRVDVMQDGYPDTPEWHDFAGALADGWSTQLQSMKHFLEHEDD